MFDTYKNNSSQVGELLSCYYFISILTKKAKLDSYNFAIIFLNTCRTKAATDYDTGGVEPYL
jgi:hypothetical protein